SSDLQCQQVAEGIAADHQQAGAGRAQAISSGRQPGAGEAADQQQDAKGEDETQAQEGEGRGVVQAQAGEDRAAAPEQDEQGGRGAGAPEGLVETHEWIPVENQAGFATPRRTSLGLWRSGKTRAAARSAAGWRRWRVAAAGAGWCDRWWRATVLARESGEAEGDVRDWVHGGHPEGMPPTLLRSWPNGQSRCGARRRRAPATGSVLVAGGVQLGEGIRLVLEGLGEGVAVLRHEDAQLLDLLLAERRHRLVQGLGQRLGQLQHLVVTIRFGLIHEQTLRIATAAVHHFDGHSSP